MSTGKFLRVLNTIVTVLKVSVTISGVSEEINEKIFISRVNLGMWPLILIISANEPNLECFNTHFWCF